MKNAPSALALIILSLVGVLSTDSAAALQTWFVALGCLMTLVMLAQVDARNLVSLRVSRWFPALIMAVYVGAVALSAHLLAAHLSTAAAIYAAMVSIALADYAGQLLVGTHLIMLIGRDHLGRPSRAQRETQYRY